MDKRFLELHQDTIVQSACDIAAEAAGSSVLGEQPTSEQQQQKARDGVATLMVAMEELSLSFERIQSSVQ